MARKFAAALAVPPIAILAAGRGTRLKPHTDRAPKCLVAVGGSPILWHQLKAIERCGASQIAIVIGYRGGMIRRYAQRNFPNLNIEYVRNRKFQHAGDIYSAYLAMKALGPECIQINSDVLFHPEILSRLILRRGSALCLRRGRCGREEMKMAVHDGYVVGLGKHLSCRISAGESMGIYRFSDKFGRLVFREMERLISEGNLDCNRSYAIEQALRFGPGQSLSYLDITGRPAIEIDFPRDLQNAAAHVLPAIIYSSR